MYGLDRIDECFPFDSFRPYQRECIEDIVRSFNRDTEVFLLNAPVGFGKSPVGICVSRMTDEKEYEEDDEGDVKEIEGQVFGAYYTTPQKLLQDQLDKDFSEYIRVIKGRNAYRCSVIPASCEYGKCQVSKYECKSLCEYKNARNEALKGQICCSNFSYLLAVGGYLFKERQLLIVDECHSVPEWALEWVTCTIKSLDINERIPEYNTFEEYVGWLKEKSEYLQSVLEKMKPDKDGEFVFGLKEKRDKLNEVISKINRLVSDYEINKEEWIHTILDKGTGKERIKFQPVTAGRFMDSLIWWRGQKKLLMSGTIFPELYVEEAGLTDKVCEYREIPSTFPVENRPVYLWFAGKMSIDYKNMTIPKMIEKIAVIVNRNKDKKGFCHCNSYDTAQELYSGLRGLGINNVILQNREARDVSLKSWMESKEPSLFLSINMVEGVDLKDDLCRYQILAKVQYPYLGDKRVKARMNMVRYRCNKCDKYFRTSRNLVDSSCSCGGTLELNMNIDIYTCDKCGSKVVSPRNLESCQCGNKYTKNSVICDGKLWYDLQAVTDIIQSYGRAVRSETDSAEYWILDESFMSLYKKRNLHFPKFFKSAVKKIK